MAISVVGRIVTRIVWAALILGAGLFWSSIAKADYNNDLKYRAQSGDCSASWVGSASSVMSCRIAGSQAYFAGSGNSGCTLASSDVNEPGGTGETVWVATSYWTNSSPCSYSAGDFELGFYIQRLACTGTDFDEGGPCAPPPPGECEEEPYTFTAGNVSGPNNYCNPVNYCAMHVTGRTGDTMTISQSGDTCVVGTDPGPEGQPTEGEPGEETCTAVGSGEYCASPTGDGDCGYFNDTYVCLQQVEPDECKPLGDGGRVCAATATTTPPVPDNGTPGVPATPDGTVSQTVPGETGDVTNNFNYYGSGTVAGSARDPGADGGRPDGGSPGNGDGEGEGEEGGACEGTGCEAGPLPELEEIGTVGEAFSAFWADLQAVPFIEAAADIAPTFSGGTCPDWSTSIGLYSADIEVDFSSMCGLWTDITPALTFVCLVMFGFLAFRVLFSA